MIPQINFNTILPEIILSAVALVLLLLEVLISPDRRDRVSTIGTLAVVGAMVAIGSLWRTEVVADGMGGLIWSDSFGFFFRAVLLTVLLIVTLLSVEYVGRKNIPAGEFFALLFFATVGGMFMAVSRDLIIFYVGLELLSISSYVLAGLLRSDDRSLEAALKYFLNGAMASAILLFGFSIFYGLTGTTDLMEMATGLSGTGMSWLAVAGLVMVTAGLGFKLAVVPFHLWVPDTYEGAPTPVSAFLSVGSKGAALAGILRIFYIALDPLSKDWMGLLAVLALLTMTLGNVAALHQKNLKRMLAYSSIAQAGYILAGVATGTSLGLSAAMFYILAYTFMNSGAFAVVITLANQGEGETVDNLAGLARREPVLAFMMFLFIISLLGIPPLAGFWAKLFVLRATVEAGFVYLAVAVVLNSAVSVGYYYGIIKAMYVTPPAEEKEHRGIMAGVATQIGIALAAAGVLVLGIGPETFLSWVNSANFISRMVP